MTYQNSRTDNILQKSSNEAKHNITQRTKYVNEIYHDEYEMIKKKKTQDRNTQNQINISPTNKLNHFESTKQSEFKRNG